VYSTRGQYVCIYDPNVTMTYEGIEYAIRAGLSRNEWVLLISFPDNVGVTPAW
jgi:hypothetical protein